MAKKTDKEKKTPIKKRATNEISTSRIILSAALEVIRKSKLQALLLYVDGLEDIAELKSIDFSGSLQVVTKLPG